MEFDIHMRKGYGDLAVQSIKNAVREGDVKFFESVFFNATILPLAENQAIINVEKTKSAAEKIRKKADIKEARRLLQEAEKKREEIKILKQIRVVEREKKIKIKENAAETAELRALDLLKKYGMTPEEVE